MILSFSAGASRPDDQAFRLVTVSATQRLDALVRLCPEVGSTADPGRLMVINAYPATTILPADVLFVDTYLRPATFARALAYAAAHDRQPVLIAQPLTAARLLLEAGNAAAPARLVILLGGYPCPHTLERWLTDRARDAGMAATIAHLYGVAEIEAGLLAGRRGPDGQVYYRPFAAGYTPRLDDLGRLAFERADGAVCHTDDLAWCQGPTWLLTPNPRRYAPSAIAAFETWSAEDWSRRTGFIRHAGDPPLCQLRARHAPRSHGEMEHFAFARLTGMTWLDKPDWSGEEDRWPARPFP
jgi:hypothetical protein